VLVALPSVGDTVPLQAAPQFFGWLANIEPSHQVFLGTRALLYLDGRADAGLSQAVELSAIGLVIGLLLGGAVIRVYDRRGYHQIPAGAEAAPAQPASPTPSADAIEPTYPSDTSVTTPTTITDS
jgi:hypothetical protein